MIKMTRFATFYMAENGMIIRREYGKTPNLNDLNGQWVLRDSEGRFIDFDSFRSDLASRNNLIIEY